MIHLLAEVLSGPMAALFMVLSHGIRINWQGYQKRQGVPYDELCQLNRSNS